MHFDCDLSHGPPSEDPPGGKELSEILQRSAAAVCGGGRNAGGMPSGDSVHIGCLVSGHSLSRTEPHLGIGQQGRGVCQAPSGIRRWIHNPSGEIFLFGSHIVQFVMVLVLVLYVANQENGRFKLICTAGTDGFAWIDIGGSAALGSSKSSGEGKLSSFRSRSL